MLLAAGVDMKVVSEIPGHASSAFTADVYTSVAEELAEQAAAVIAAFIPRKANAFGRDARSSNVPAQPASVTDLSRGFG